MAVNKQPWLRNDDGDNKPLRVWLPVAAGSTRTIKRGEICTLATGTAVPAVSGNATMMVVADEEQKSTDVARMLPFIVPRPGDIFEFELAAARAVEYGDPLAISDSQKLAYTAAGTNLVARASDNSNRPMPAENDTTLRSVSYVACRFAEAASYLAQLTGKSS